MGSILTKRRGAVATIQINHPPLNFITDAVMTELENTLSAWESDHTIRCVVLTGAVPDVFINHYDIPELLDGTSRAGLTLSATIAPVALAVAQTLLRIPGLGGFLAAGPAAGVAALLRFHRVIWRMVTSDKIYIAAINGPAVGAGFELALACDLRVMVDDGSTVGLLENLLGLLPGGGGSQLLTRLLGVSRAMEMFLEGRLLTAKEALAEGIVHRIAAPDDLLDQVDEIAARLARRSPAAVRSLKHSVYQGSSRRLARGLAMERADFLAVASRRTAQRALGRYRDELSGQEATGQRPIDFFDQQLPAWRAGTAAEFAD